jgi:flagella basal body P-ring formation protein FlgA
MGVVKQQRLKNGCAAQWRLWTRRLARAAAALALFLPLAGAQAQSRPEPDYPALALQWARTTAAASVAGSSPALRTEVSVGALDSRLRLAPCGNVEPYLPVGVRLWGKTRVGLRCVDGMAHWNVTVPATVRVLGSAWVVRAQIGAGEVLRETDAVAAEVDWAEETSPVLAERAAWVGQIATRAMGTGQTLRQGLVKPAQVFQAGAQVKVVAQGAGFEVSADAQALSAGIVGQPARVRMDNGRIATGVVLDTRTVKIEL